LATIGLRAPTAVDFLAAAVRRFGFVDFFAVPARTGAEARFGFVNLPAAGLAGVFFFAVLPAILRVEVRGRFLIVAIFRVPSVAVNTGCLMDRI